MPLLNLLCPACHTPLPSAADGVVTCSSCAAEVDVTRAGTLAGRPRFVPEIDRAGTEVGGYRVASGVITVASLVAFILFLFMLIAPLGSAFGAISSVNQALGALGRIEEINAIPGEDEGDAAIEPAAPVTTTAAISFDDVRFRYPETAHKTEREKLIAAELGEDEVAPVDREVLKGVSFEVPRGSRVALVGCTLSGGVNTGASSLTGGGLRSASASTTSGSPGRCMM